MTYSVVNRSGKRTCLVRDDDIRDWLRESEGCEEVLVGLNVASLACCLELLLGGVAEGVVADVQRLVAMPWPLFMCQLQTNRGFTFLPPPPALQAAEQVWQINV